MLYICPIEATLSSKQRSYIGVTEGSWKQRYYNHTKSFRKAKYKNETALPSFLFFMGAENKV